GHWYNRLTIIYTNKLKQIDKALEIIKITSNDKNILEHYQYSIYKRCLRILSKNKQHELYQKATEFINNLNNPKIVNEYNEYIVDHKWETN
ncbi:hypothetical protein MXB_971, partial [Myxobolus squamalis]